MVVTDCDCDNKENSNGENDKGDNIHQDEPGTLVNHKIKEYFGFC